MNPQRASTNIWYVPQKKFNFFPKPDDDDILTAAEKYMEKHGTDRNMCRDWSFVFKCLMNVVFF